MTTSRSPAFRDPTTLLAAGAIAALVAMVAITFATGVSQETFEIYRAPAEYCADLRAHVLALRALFGIDSAFLVLYSALLLAFVRAIARPEVRLFLIVAVAASLVTGVLDMVEDHHILAMLRAAERGIDATSGEIAFQHALSQVKFNLSYLGLFLIGLSVPRDTRAGVVLAWLLTAGTLVQGMWLYAAPDDALPLGNVGRWVGYVAGFSLLTVVARHRRAAGAVATGAPA